MISTIAGKYSSSFVVCRNPTTGKIHKYGGGVSLCGTSRRNRSITMDEATSTNAEMFCEKCYPKGKPEQFYSVQE